MTILKVFDFQAFWVRDAQPLDDSSYINFILNITSDAQRY